MPRLDFAVYHHKPHKIKSIHASDPPGSKWSNIHSPPAAELWTIIHCRMRLQDANVLICAAECSPAIASRKRIRRSHCFSVILSSLYLVTVSKDQRMVLTPYNATCSKNWTHIQLPQPLRPPSTSSDAGHAWRALRHSVCWLSADHWERAPRPHKAAGQTPVFPKDALISIGFACTLEDDECNGIQFSLFDQANFCPILSIHVNCTMICW